MCKGAAAQTSVRRGGIRKKVLKKIQAYKVNIIVKVFFSINNNDSKLIKNMHVNLMSKSINNNIKLVK